MLSYIGGPFVPVRSYRCVSVSVILKAGLGTIIITLVLCFSISLFFNHIDIIPFVGECGLFPPEKYIFRCGIITCAVLLCISCVGVYWSNDGYRCVITLIAALLGCVGLAGLGSVTPIEFALLHEGFTFLYLISFVVYFILFTYHSKVKMVSHLLFITRCILAIISSVCLIIYIVLYIKYDFNQQVTILTPVLQWLLYINGFLYLYTISYEFSNVHLTLNKSF
jgi:hypothetical protein